MYLLISNINDFYEISVVVTISWLTFSKISRYFVSIWYFKFSFKINFFLNYNFNLLTIILITENMLSSSVGLSSLKGHFEISSKFNVGKKRMTSIISSCNVSEKWNGLYGEISHCIIISKKGENNENENKKKTIIVTWWLKTVISSHEFMMMESTYQCLKSEIFANICIARLFVTNEIL